MKWNCKNCKKEMDETEWAMIQKHTGQIDNCLDCFAVFPSEDAPENLPTVQARFEGMF